ncbi:acyltransferase [Sinorhizobium medicae]|nr:acyltransferase [Sinorhizobium medicae]
MPKKNVRFIITVASLLGIVGVSEAGETAEAMVAAGLNVICAPFAAKVSSSEGNFKSRSKYGCLGAFQFCPGTFELYYSGSEDQFLNSPSDQVVAWTKYERTQWGLATKYNLVSLIGSKVCYGGKCDVVDHSAILMACQFGCGNKGKLANYVRGKDCDAKNVKDGNSVSVCTYLIRGARFDVSCFTGEKTAQPTPEQSQVVSNCPVPSNTKMGGSMEIVVKNFGLRFDEGASTENVKRIVELLRSLN